MTYFVLISFPDEKITPECLAEMNEVRQSLLSDYKINPELIAMCEHEIQACIKENNGDSDKLEEGTIVHCLMDVARTKSRKKAPDNRVPMSAQCQRAVSWRIIAVIIIYCGFIYFLWI